MLANVFEMTKRSADAFDFQFTLGEYDPHLNTTSVQLKEPIRLDSARIWCAEMDIEGDYDKRPDYYCYVRQDAESARNYYPDRSVRRHEARYRLFVIVDEKEMAVAMALRRAILTAVYSQQKLHYSWKGAVGWAKNEMFRQEHAIAETVVTAAGESTSPYLRLIYNSVLKRGLKHFLQQHEEFSGVLDQKALDLFIDRSEPIAPINICAGWCGEEEGDAPHVTQERSDLLLMELSAPAYSALWRDAVLPGCEWHKWSEAIRKSGETDSQRIIENAPKHGFAYQPMTIVTAPGATHVLEKLRHRVRPQRNLAASLTYEVELVRSACGTNYGVRFIMRSPIVVMEEKK